MQTGMVRFGSVSLREHAGVAGGQDVPYPVVVDQGAFRQRGQGRRGVCGARVG